MFKILETNSFYYSIKYENRNCGSIILSSKFWRMYICFKKILSELSLYWTVGVRMSNLLPKRDEYVWKPLSLHYKSGVRSEFGRFGFGIGYHTKLLVLELKILRATKPWQHQEP